MSSSTSESDFEAGTPRSCCDSRPAKEPHSVRKAFRHYRIVFAISVLGEWLFCHFMWEFEQKSERLGKIMPGDVDDHLMLAEIYWVVFYTFLVARIVLVAMWRSEVCGLRDSTYASAFMFCSTFQWVYYLLAYYKLSEEMTGLVWTEKVMIGPDKSSLTDNSMFNCLDENGTLACQQLESFPMVCQVLYNKSSCAAKMMVATQTGAQECCVKNVYSLSRPRVGVSFLDMPMTVAFSILQWLAVLAMKWVLEQTPMLNGNKGGNFINGATIDILDSVIFGQYLLSDKILYPLYGISFDVNKGEAIARDWKIYRSMFATWAIAFITAVLSPVVYTFLRQVDSEEPATVRTYSTALIDLMESLRMLRNHESHRLVDEALKLQLEQYVNESGGHSETHTVLVVEDDEDGCEQALKPKPIHSPMEDFFSAGGMQVIEEVQRGLSDYSLTSVRKRPTRPGVAKHIGGAEYRVSFTDKLEPKTATIDVMSVQPDMSASKGACDPGCMSGWCRGTQSAHDRFDNRAEVIDAFRSLFLLELPFFMWRVYMESQTLTLDSWNIIVMAKNVVWGIHDFLVIMSCNNPSAQIFGFTPLPALSTMISGSAMSGVWVGPAGFFRIAADFATAKVKQNLEARKTQMNLHKAWLIVEREKLVHNDGGDTQGIALYDAALRDITLQLEELTAREELIHT